MIIKLILIAFLACPAIISADSPPDTLLISLFFGNIPPNTQALQQAGNHYSINGNRLDDRLIELTTRNNRSASIELTTHEYTANLYNTLFYSTIAPGIAIGEVERVSGFHVHPILTELGIEISIDAQTQQSSTNKNTYRIQTSILTQEGEWTLLTGETKTSNRERHAYKTKSDRENMVWIKASKFE